MPTDCTRCGRAIEAAETRYTRKSPESEPDHFCSLNCIADTENFDEREVQSRLFDPVPAE